MRPRDDSRDPSVEVTTEQACRIAGIDKRTLRRWCQAGLTHSVSAEWPYRYYFRVADLQAMRLRMVDRRPPQLQPVRKAALYDYG